MKSTVECWTCGRCAYVLPPGFTSVPEYYCTQFNIEVEPDDACTMGCVGVPFQAVLDNDLVTLSSHPHDGMAIYDG